MALTIEDFNSDFSFRRIDDPISNRKYTFQKNNPDDPYGFIDEVIEKVDTRPKHLGMASPYPNKVVLMTSVMGEATFGEMDLNKFKKIT